MAIFGPSMVNSDRGGVGYASLLVLICDRIDPLVDGLSKFSDGEQPVSAMLEALRVLCEAYPKESGVVLEKEQLEKWQSVFLPWLESNRSTLPVEYADTLINSARSDLEYLRKIAFL